MIASLLTRVWIVSVVILSLLFITGQSESYNNDNKQALEQEDDTDGPSSLTHARLRREYPGDDDDDGNVRHNRRLSSRTGATTSEPFDPYKYSINADPSEQSQLGEGNNDDDDDDMGLDNNETVAINCSSCAVRENRRHVRIEMIKKDVLRKLKLEQVPRFNSTKPNLTALPADIFEYSQTVYAERGSEGNFQTIIFGEEPPMLHDIEANLSDEPHLRLHTSRLIYFRFGEEAIRSTLNSAALSVYVKRRVYDFQQARGEIKIKMVIYNQETNRYEHRHEHPDVSRRFVLSEDNTGKWYSFNGTDLMELIDIWKTNPDENYGLEIFCHGYGHGNLAILDPEDDRGPLLRLDMSELLSQRHKRRHLENDCNEGSPESKCCRYPLIVDFDAFGWDWILQPRQYPAFYCSGECPFSYLPTRPHTHLVSLQRDASQPGGPCCTPVRMSPISMIYYNNDGAIMAKDLADMVVDSCGCN